MVLFCQEVLYETIKIFERTTTYFAIKVGDGSGMLLQKITDLEKELTITGDDEQILETKQIVINELIRIRQKKKLKKQKEKLETNKKQVGQLDLCIGDYNTCYVQKIYINGVVGCLVYDREKGKENNYIGELNLINQDYSILYQILNRYDLISYCENEKKEVQGK